MRLQGKVAIVTGAARGTGAETVRVLAAEGAQVVGADIADAEGIVRTDVTSEDDWAALVAATVERFGRLDILVNNAATNPYMGPAIDIDLGRYDKTVEVNLRGPLVWTQLAWNKWMKEHGGTVLNIASIGGLTFGGGIGIYDNTKAALIHLTGHLAHELAPNVRVNAVAPGLVKTDFARALWEPAEELVAKRTPLHRLGVPEDIAAAATFLCSDASSWVTGHTLVVDGGALLGAAGLA